MRAYARQESVHRASNLSARDELIVAHLEVARRIAGRLARRLPPNIPIDEVVAAAMLGLSEAAERFDPNHGEPFIAFATPRIKGAVLDELRRGDPLPRRKRILARKVSQTISKLSQRLGRAAEDEEIAAELGVSVDEYRDELEGLTHVGLVELDETWVGGPDEETAAGRDHLASPFARVERGELQKCLVAALKTLSDRDALVMSLYYEEQLTFAEIAHILSVTESRICQIHSQSILRLRARLAETEEQ